jgi:hypothetical protein
MFPHPVHYQREDCPTGWYINDWETANQLLSYLNTKGRSFAIFTKNNGSYVQCAGSKTRLTVEARIYVNEQQFQHFVFGSGPIQNQVDAIATTEYQITVDKSQILRMRDARLIMKPWLEGNDFPAKYTLTNITERFIEATDSPF